MRIASTSMLWWIVAPALALAVTACGPSSSLPERPRSAGEHLVLAARCDAAADEHERAALRVAEGDPTYVCDGGTFTSQTTSGTEPLTHWTPCWSYDRERTAAHLRRAAQLRDEARRHREIARNLIDVERTVCAPLSEDELARTPFFHRDDVESAESLHDGNRLVGATITFRPVAGLDAAWMQVALACHHARAAVLGYPPTYLSYDPSVLPHAQATAIDRDGRVVVTIRSPDDVEAAVIWGRAADLCEPIPETD
ncbi:MAG TPA: hypothetical protein VHE35_27835 [Kofleriaceae bacterium]|nr:hypothetical protein [Kofleriaceae bacterium]